MSAIPAESLERLKQLVAEVALPEVGDAVATGIDVAVQLLTDGVDGEAIVRVAALEPRAPRSDAEPAIREMLAELGLAIPEVDDDGSLYELLRHGVGFWNLPIETFEGPFYVRLPEWDNQGTADRALVQLLDLRDRTTAVASRPALEERIRAAARYADDSDALIQIGTALSGQDINLPVRIPRELADIAQKSRARVEIDLGAEELLEERELRHRAATLALIGVAVEERGTNRGDHVVVDLDPATIAEAVRAATTT